MPQDYFTIGHSNRGIEEFIELLRASRIGLVADVRRLPGSRAWPQFDAEALAESLASAQIGYEHIAALGGRRSRPRGEEASPNTFWENRSFRNYADYAMTEAFASGLARLRQLGAERRVAIMCAEAVWWRCHRRIIADYLLAGGDAVFHILATDTVKPAEMTDGARPTGDGSLVYPGPQPAS